MWQDLLNLPQRQLLLKLLPLLFFLLLTAVFFYKIFFGRIPLPMDLLTGAYYPWLDFKWGFPVGVPVQNPAISDAFSLFFPWRGLAVNIAKSGIWPLWNPYSFSGVPLLSNWETSFFYPLNLLMFLLGDLNGWTAMVFLQPLLSMIFMYWYLRTISFSKAAAIFGAIVFGFAGWMLIFLEVTFSQGGIWLPLALLSVEKYLRQKRAVWLSLLSLALLPILTAGNFQVALFSGILLAVYFTLRMWPGKMSQRYLQAFLVPGLFALLGMGLAAVQLLPMTDLFLHSIRTFDTNIAQYNFGLLPLRNLLTFISPDFFGNPVTGNFRGFLYHETSGYFGVVALILVIWVIFKARDSISKFYIAAFLMSFILALDTFLGRALYDFKLPLISTSYASRLLFVTDFSAAVLAAKGLELLDRKDRRIWIIPVVLLAFLAGTLLVMETGIKVFGSGNVFDLAHTQAEVLISLKNCLLPAVLIITFMLVIRFGSKRSTPIILTALLLFDLFRFGWKYNPFVPARLLYPQTPAINFIQQNIGYYRFDRERTEVMPPNTWIPYKLMSPSGYDPLYPEQYARFYNLYNNHDPAGSVGRYAELENYNSPSIDLAGVKYLIVAKWDKDGQIDKTVNSWSVSITNPKYKKVFEDKSIIVLENTQVLPRVLLFDKFAVEKDSLAALEKIYHGLDFRHEIVTNQPPALPLGPTAFADQAEITDYQANTVTVHTRIKSNSLLMLTDSNYPGWQVSIDGQKANLLTADGIFRATTVPGGRHVVKFEFVSEPFNLGLKITVISFLLWAGLSVVLARKKVAG